MEKYRAIPEGYMTVGEAAKKMGVSVRTLQYYDKEGIVSPSAQSEGGRRIYTEKDLIKIHQILSLKSLGFSLDDIKKRLFPLDTPDEVINALTSQAEDIKNRIKVLSESLREIELLKEEVIQMNKVDFKKYADIIVNLQMNNQYYWLIKHFDDDMMEHIRKNFDQKSGKSFMDDFNKINDEIIKLIDGGVKPESDEALDAAKRFWEMVSKFTGGNMDMLPKLMSVGKIDGSEEFIERQKRVNEFIGKSLEIYFLNSGINPFEGCGNE